MNHLKSATGYARVNRQRPCWICGKPDWCVYTRDEEVSVCMRVSTGARKANRQGGFIHVHAPAERPTPDRATVTSPANPSPRAPLYIRAAVYQTWLTLLPATHYAQHLLEGAGGLLARGFAHAACGQFGALPATQSERTEIVQHCSKMLRQHFPAYVRTVPFPLFGVPGFWQDEAGQVHCGKARDYRYPALVIPYRNRQGLIQACQLRASGPAPAAGWRYCWLSSAQQPQGASSGAPLHFTWRARAYQTQAPLWLTEGALKAESLVSFRPGWAALATAGVGVGHAASVAATLGQPLIVAFDADARTNPAVCVQLASFLAARCAAHWQRADLAPATWIAVWPDRAKGIDDALRQGLRPRLLSMREWVATLPHPLPEHLRDGKTARIFLARFA